VLVDQVGTTSFRLRYDIDRVDYDVDRVDYDIDSVDYDRVDTDRVDLERVEASGHGRTRCAQVAITYVCVAVDGRRKVPIPRDLREALARHHT